MARGHHHRPEHHPHSDHPVHHMKRGGKIPEEHEGKMHDYTANSEVVKEAEGEERHRGGRKRAAGGVVARKHGGAVHHGKHHVSHHHAEAAVVHHHHHKRGGGVKHVDGEGAKTKHRRLDRPGRKRGGGVGADMTPLTTAARTHQAGAHHADNDELAEG